MTARNFDYFQYSLPQEPAKRYADAAVAILKEIKEKYPSFYKQFRRPSEVLTLSGVRAFDTYHELGKDAAPGDIAGLKSLFKKFDVLLIEETFEVCNERNEDHRYSLVHTGALLDIPHRYGHLPKPGWIAPNLKALERDGDFSLWWLIWQQVVAGRASQSRGDELLRSWLRHDFLAVHHLTFGILLGYPGEAICSALYETEQDYDKGRIVDADIQYARAFDGPRPVYSYLREIADNPQIQAHQKLWSGILTEVYGVIEPDIVTK